MNELMIKLIAAAGVVGLLGFGYLEWRDVQREAGAAPYKAKLATLQQQADDKLKAERERVAAIEQRMQADQLAQTKKDADNGKVIADLGRQLRDAGRLRDPGATTGRGGCGADRDVTPGAAPGADDDPQGPGLLSAELSNLLRTQAAEADAINIAYASCRADALSIRQHQ